MNIKIDTTTEPVVYHIEGNNTRLDCILHPDFKPYTQQLHLAYDYIVNSYPVLPDGGTIVVGYSEQSMIEMDSDNGIVYIGFTSNKPNVLEYNTRSYNAVFGAVVDAEGIEAIDSAATATLH